MSHSTAPSRARLPYSQRTASERDAAEINDPPPPLHASAAQVAPSAAVADPQDSVAARSGTTGRALRLKRPPARVPNRLCCRNVADAFCIPPLWSCARAPGAVLDGGCVDGRWGNDARSPTIYPCRADAGRNQTPAAAGQSARPGQRPRPSTTRVAGSLLGYRPRWATTTSHPQRQLGGNGLAWADDSLGGTTVHVGIRLQICLHARRGEGVRS